MITTDQKIVGTLGAKTRYGITEVDANLFIPIEVPDKCGALDRQCGGERLTSQSALVGHMVAGTLGAKTLEGGGVAGRDAVEGFVQPCWWDGGQVSQTLDAVLHKGQTMPEKNRFPAVLVYNPTQITSKTNQSNPKPGDPAPTLTKDSHVPIVINDQGGDSIHIEQDGNSPTLRANSHQHEPIVVQPATLMVRRLTPTECERLQGFPDNYTNIPGAADGPRYKALGNSMTVHVMHWIGRRIDFVDKVVNQKTK